MGSTIHAGFEKSFFVLNDVIYKIGLKIGQCIPLWLVVPKTIISARQLYHCKLINGFANEILNHGMPNDLILIISKYYSIINE